MDGDFAPLAEYAELCREHGAMLIVDEAHAVGIYGERGSGLIEAAGISNGMLVSINTAGKALGVSGAFVCGPHWAIEYLVQRARPFIFSTAPPPAVAAAIDASLDVIASEPDRRRRLLDLSKYLWHRMWRTLQRAAPALVPAHGGTSPIVPVILGDNARAVAIAESLQREGFDVRAIRPPSVPAGTARLRLAVNVNLTEAILDRFVDRFADALCAASS
jgi:8-amino-7-oxononanoate synthase